MTNKNYIYHRDVFYAFYACGASQPRVKSEYDVGSRTRIEFYLKKKERQTDRDICQSYCGLSTVAANKAASTTQFHADASFVELDTKRQLENCEKVDK